MAETCKAHHRRQREGFYATYCTGKGIDIGSGPDPLPVEGTRQWDWKDGDAQHMAGVPAGSFDFVYSSHCLEHIANPYMALLNWWRILKPGGHLLLAVPSRDHYEKRRELPSRFNRDHKQFFTLNNNEAPHTIGLMPLIRAAIPDGEVLSARYEIAGFESPSDEAHSGGEYSIEVILRKPH